MICQLMILKFESWSDNMSTCNCIVFEKLEGDEAYTYSRQHLQKVTNHGGWVFLWKCTETKIYWEASWVGGDGFDNGKFTLRKLSTIEVQRDWPEIIDN